MDLKNIKKITFLKLQLGGAIFVLIVLLISSFFVFGPSISQVARAIVNNYDKNSGDSLNNADWNNILADFLSKDGGSQVDRGDGTMINNEMTGNLEMGGNRVVNLSDPVNPQDAATRSFVENISSPISDTSGNPLRVVCGETTSVGWVDYVFSTSDAVYMDVDTSAAGFTTTPTYFSFLAGVSGLWRTQGASSIYNATPVGFRVYIDDYNDTVDIDPIIIGPGPGNWDWHIQWCGFGQ